MNRLVLLGTGALVGIVLLLVGWTWLLDAVIYPNQVVAVVEGKEIKGEQYISRTRLNRQQMINNYYQSYSEYTQMRQFFGDDPRLQQQYFTVMAQIEMQLDPEYAAEYTVNQLVNEELIKLEAAALGISISDADFAKSQEELFGFFPNGTPTPAIFPTALPTSTLSAQQFSLIGIDPTATLDIDAESTEEGETPETELETATLEPTATSEPTTAPATATQTAGPSPTPLPTATAYTQQLYEENLATYYTSYQQEIGVRPEDLEDAYRTLLLREALKDQVTADLQPLQEQVWARHILVSTLEEAEEAINRVNAGEDFGDLAIELSLDTGSASVGGDLGWFAKEVMVEPFGNAAFALEIGEVSEPVESQFGWHIIQVLGHEDRGLSQAEHEQLREQAFLVYLDGLREKYDWRIEDNWRDMAPETPRIPSSLLQ
ncbi:MAG: peptidylprolyl isomerase [Anaerolineales bacterium]|nr:peptidylprolyl isomerase [Anaerolineales bacterium]MCW5856259.1 peptidylprolyl isomerase [Anaerolineales bacterium]